MPSFINIRVIVALMMREMSTRYGKSAGGYVWAILEPLGVIALLSVVFGFVVRSPAIGDSFALFFATGFITFHFYMELSQFAAGAVLMNRPLLTYPRVTPIDTILARALLQFFTLSVAGAIIFTGIVQFDDVRTSYDFAAIVKAVAYASVLGVGIGATNAVIFAYVPTYQNVYRILTRPLFLVSGIFFMFEEMPPLAQDVLWWNPLIHAVGLMRQGFYPIYDGAYISELYLGGVGVVFLTLGLFLVYSNKTFLIEQR